MPVWIYLRVNILCFHVPHYSVSVYAFHPIRGEPSTTRSPGLLQKETARVDLSHRLT